MSILEKYSAAMTNKDGSKIDSGAIEKDFEYYDSKQLWFDLKNIGEELKNRTKNGDSVCLCVWTMYMGLAMRNTK